MADSAVGIDPQQSDGCCGNVRLAEQHAVAPVEMFAPDINSRIEQSCQFVGIRCVCRDIASFETVAQRTTSRGFLVSKVRCAFEPGYDRLREAAECMTAAFGNTRSSCSLSAEPALAGQLSSRFGLIVQERNASFSLQQIQKLSDPQIIVQRGFLHFRDRACIFFCNSSRIRSVAVSLKRNDRNSSATCRLKVLRLGSTTSSRMSASVSARDEIMSEC